MTNTIISRTRCKFGNVDAVIVVMDVTGYSAGGEVVTAAILGLEGQQKPLITSVVARETNGRNVVWEHDVATEKLFGTVSNTGVEVGAVDVGEITITAVNRAGGF